MILKVRTKHIVWMDASTPRLAVLRQMNIALSLVVLSLFAVLWKHHLLPHKMPSLSVEIFFRI